MSTHDDAPESNPALNDRLASWKSTYQITNDVDAYLLRQLIAYSLLLDQTAAEERALLKAETLNAQVNWDNSKRLDAAKTGSRLTRNPELITLKLRQTKQGVDWLLTRWNHLADILHKGRSWTDKQRELALDLTGAPADFRDPAHIILDPAALAQNEISTLTALRDGPLADLDAHARECSLDGAPLDPSRPLMAARRRHAALTRLFQAADKLLRSKSQPAPEPRVHDAKPSTPTPPPLTDFESMLLNPNPTIAPAPFVPCITSTEILTRNFARYTARLQNP